MPPDEPVCTNRGRGDRRGPRWLTGTIERAEPGFAAAVRAAFERRKHATMATVRADGSPRISGTEVEFDADGGLYLGMMPATRRAADLRRDPRVALHCPTVDPPADDPSGWPGEAKLDARAVAVTTTGAGEAGDRFRLDIERVVLTRVADGALEIAVWRPGTALRTVRRGCNAGARGCETAEA